jgi:hypothetical protein
VSDCDCPPAVYTSATHDSVQSVEPDKTAEEILSKWMDKDMSYSKSALGAMNEFANQFKTK